MSEILKIVVFPFFVAGIVTYFLTPVVIRFAGKVGIIDDPKKNKHIKVLHTYPIPRGGGISLFIGILLSTILFLPLDKHLVGILLGGLLLVVLGVIDDKYNLSPYKRLIIQIVVSCIPIAVGIGISFINTPLPLEFWVKIPAIQDILNINSQGIIDLSYPRLTFNFLGEHSIWIFSDIFAILWLVTLMNFINMGASGLDGQLSGTTAISALTIAALSLRYSADIAQWPVIILAMATAGAYFGFLRWHFFPQKIMPGFGGSTLAGFMLGILSILSTTKVGTLLVVLAIPIVDTCFVIVRRLISGKSPFWGDRGHLHHRLLDIGLSKVQVAFFYWGISAFLGIIALNLNAESKFYTILGVTILIGGLIFLSIRKK